MIPATGSPDTPKGMPDTPMEMPDMPKGEKSTKALPGEGGEGEGDDGGEDEVGEVNGEEAGEGDGGDAGHLPEVTKGGECRDDDEGSEHDGHTPSPQEECGEDDGSALNEDDVADDSGAVAQLEHGHHEASQRINHRPAQEQPQIRNGGEPAVREEQGDDGLAQRDADSTPDEQDEGEDAEHAQVGFVLFLGVGLLGDLDVCGIAHTAFEGGNGGLL